MARMHEKEIKTELLRDENDKLKCLLKQWQDGEFGKPKHIIEIKETLGQDVYDRLKRQCAENFGEGKFILLEGGAQYKGITEVKP